MARIKIEMELASFYLKDGSESAFLWKRKRRQKYVSTKIVYCFWGLYGSASNLGG